MSNARGKIVHHLALAFVTPLRADDDDCFGHLFCADFSAFRPHAAPRLKNWKVKAGPRKSADT